VRAQIERSNAVTRAFVRRLGFVEVGADAVYVQIERPPGPVGDPAP
jgi:hypothetical protein